jgi:hypothetical protein
VLSFQKIGQETIFFLLVSTGTMTDISRFISFEDGLVYTLSFGAASMIGIQNQVFSFLLPKLKRHRHTIGSQLQ